MLIIENCNSLSDLRQKLIDGEEVRTARDEPCEGAISRSEVIKAIDEREDVNGKVDAESIRTDIVLMLPVKTQELCEDWYDVPSDEMTLGQARQAVKDLRKKLAEYLEQEPCEDAISRHAAIDTIESWLSCDNYNKAERHIMRATQSMLYDLPPVNPTKTGHWVLINVEGSKVWHCSCSKCNKDPMRFVGGSENWWLIKSKLPMFCPNCGAKMESER